MGAGYYQEYLTRLAAELGVGEQVTFTGFVDTPQLVDLYNAADIVLVPSRDEAFGLVIAEASSLGKVIIASKVGGIVEQINHGENGLLCEPGNAKDLASQVQWVFENLVVAQNLAWRAQERAVGAYSWDDVAQKTIHLYQLARACLTNREGRESPLE